MADWIHVQNKQTTTNSGGSTNTITLSSAVTSGNVLIGTIMISAGFPIVSIVDDKSNNYLTTGSADDTNSLTTYGFYPDPDVGGGLLTNGPSTLTVTTVGNTTVFWANIAEFSPPTGTVAICLDGSQYLNSESAGTLPNFATLNNDALVFAVRYSTGVSFVGSGFTLDSGSNTQQCSEYKIQSTAGNVGVTFSSPTGSAWTAGFAIAPVARANWIPVQSVDNHSAATGTSLSVSLPGAIQNGDYIFGAFSNGSAVAGSDTSDLTSFTDDKSHTWPVNTLTPNSGGATLFWLGPFNNGAKTITANVASTSTAMSMIYAEFRPPLNIVSLVTDGYAQTQTGTTSATAGPISTGKNGDLLISMCAPSAGGSSPTNNFNVISNPASSFSLGYQIQPLAGSVSASWSFASGTINQYLAAFNAQLPSNANIIMLPARLIQ